MLKTDIKIILNKKDITQDIKPFLLSLNYIDRTNGCIDDLEIEVQDISDIWIKHWFPEKGDSIEASFIVINESGKEQILNCGKMEIDELTYYPLIKKIKIKATSLPISSLLRGVVRSRAWQNIKLNKIHAQICKENKLEGFFDTNFNPVLKRQDQRQETDAGFLLRLCEKYGLFCKVSNGKIIIYEQIKYESKDPVFTFDRENLSIWGVTDAELSTTSYGTYTACETQYYDAKKDEVITYKFKPYSSVEGPVLRLNTRYESKALAMQAAQTALGMQNAKGITGRFSFLGNPVICASQNAILKNFNKFDGKITFEEVKHSYDKSNGYTTDIQFRSCVPEVIIKAKKTSKTYTDLLSPILGVENA